MSAKTFVFRMAWGKYDGTAIINYTQADIDLMQECINQEKAHGTIYISTSQKTGNPYAYIAPNQEQVSPKEAMAEMDRPMQTEESTGADTTGDDDSSLPF